MIKSDATANGTVPIQISSWNIRGFKSKIVNNKLSDASFLQEIQNDDIVSLVETHSVDNNLSIPGFKRVDIKNRSSTSIKGSGGLACFAKEKLVNEKLVIPIKTDNDDSLWIKLKKYIFDKKRDVYIGTAYLTPYRNNNDNSKNFLALFEEILSFQEKGEVIVQGDFNARTNVDDDTIAIDKHDDNELMIPTENLSQNVHGRNSEDNVPSDHRGKELLEMCKSLGLLILNGRKVGDLFGKYTSFQWNGSSVVDYVLASNSVFSSISYFKVGRYIPWLSDHCALRYSLDSCLKYEDKLETKDTGIKLEKLFWNEDSPEKFTSILEMHEQEISSILNVPDANADDIVKKFQNLITAVTKEGNFIKKSGKKPSTDEPWFDNECKRGKEHVTNIGKSLQSCPSDKNLRKSLFEGKKKFRKLIYVEKRNYTHKRFLMI